MTGGGTTGNVILNVDFGAGTNQAARGDHTHDAIYQIKYGKVAVAAQSGGDYTDPVAAMAALATWCGIPSSTNPCLLKIMPGVYDIGNNSLQMQPYVDIEGSGENVTTISGTPTFTSGWPPNVGVLMGANNAELRFLTVRNIGTLGNVAIVNISSFPSLLNVTTEASAGILNCGISNHPGTAPVMTNVMAIASGGDNSVAVSNWGGNLNQSWATIK